MRNLIKTFSINSNIWTLNRIEEIDLNINFKLLVSDSGNFVEILIPQIFSRFFSFSNTYLPFFPSHHFFSVNSQTPPPSPLQPHPNGNLSMTGNLSGLRTISWNTIAVKICVKANNGISLTSLSYYRKLRPKSVVDVDGPDYCPGKHEV